MSPVVTGGPVGSYPTVSPLPHGVNRKAVSFLWLFLVYRNGTAGDYPVPRFPESGLSSIGRYTDSDNQTPSFDPLGAS